jgi:hypothetical protein
LSSTTYHGHSPVSYPRLLNLGLLGGLIALLRKAFQPSVNPETLAQLAAQLNKIDLSISQGLRSVTTEMAGRLESTKDDYDNRSVTAWPTGSRESASPWTANWPMAGATDPAPFRGPAGTNDFPGPYHFAAESRIRRAEPENGPEPGSDPRAG